jgi:putative ABC transport system permease protein
MLHDLVWTYRWLTKNLLFTGAVTAILALGIGVNTAIFSIVDAVLLRPLPYTAADRLVSIQATSAKNPTVGISAQDYLEWRTRRDLFEKTIPYIRDIATMIGGDDPDQVVALRTPGEFFAILGARASIGRALVASDDGANVAVLSNRLWQRRFRGDPGVMGRAITLSDEAYTIVGVMPPEFDFPASDIEMWVPHRLAPSATGVNVIARLASGITAQQAEMAMEPIAAQMRQRDPRKNAGLKMVVQPWRDYTLGKKYELTLVLVLAAVALVLLIACADASSLLLSRAVQRQREIAIRVSLGAGFWAIARQLFVESCTLALAGSIAGIAAANYALRFLVARIAALPIVLPHLQRTSIDGRVFAFSGAVLAAVTFLCAIAPVMMARKTELQSVLRGGQGSSVGSGVFSVLIAAETAFAFVLLVGAGLMVRSLIRLQEADHGFHSDHVLTVRVPLGSRTQTQPAGRETRPLQIAYYRDLMHRLERIPNLGTVALVNNLPLSGANTTTTSKGPEGETILTVTRTISPRYFAAMGIPLLAGRIFTDTDVADAPRVAIINQFLARQMFPGRDPIGQRLGEGPATVVGVVKDSSQMSYEAPAQAEIYLPYTQYIFGAFLSTIVVRTPGDPLAAAGMLQQEIHAFDPKQPITKIETMDDVVADSIWRPRFSAWLFSVLGALALALTAAGVYGVIAYTTSLRTREVGIRMALGARPSDVIALIFRNALVPLNLGLLGGVVAAMIASRALAGILYGIRASDPISYLGAGGILLVLGAAAAIRPAWQASRADPLIALRIE